MQDKKKGSLRLNLRCSSIQCLCEKAKPPKSQGADTEEKVK